LRYIRDQFRIATTGELTRTVSGHKRTFRNVRVMSALPPKADID